MGKKFQISGVCLPVTGEEEDYLLFSQVDGDKPRPRSIGASDLIEESAGIKATRWNDSEAFQYPESDEHWGDIIKKYRKQYKRKFPQVCRVKITVEAEPLPEAESEAFFKKVGDYYSKTAEGDDEDDI